MASSKLIPVAALSISVGLFISVARCPNIPGNHVAFLSPFRNHGNMKSSDCTLISLET